MPLPLNEMTAEEKIQTMEATWQNLSANPESVESPDWHADEFRIREAQVASGKAKFIDWENLRPKSAA